MRALLRALPEPGPMPEELIARIQARLAIEQEHRTNGTSDLSPAAALGRGDNLIDLAAERSSRRPGRTLAILGAAAVGLMLTTVAINQFVGFGGTPGADSAAFAPTTGRSADDGAGADSGAQADDASGGAEAGPPAAAASGEAQEQAAAGAADEGSQTDSGQADTSLPYAARSIILVPDLGDLPALSTDGYAPLISAAAESASKPSSASTLTVTQANSCWIAVAGDGAWDNYFAATAHAAKEPVVVLLGRDFDGSGHAWVLPAGCVDAADTQPLSDAAIAP
ncbi:MAG: hypothetical protein Q4P07_03300 [Ornithinimicrobium sp.]|uniref:hypothetical protein n=1 Tax=Ornithinimicrobium sp. TaxID=1977084 RepID=UPI0026DF3593|nr:hypothetical protein [Ornithinimicrobium sp.]MDO5739156.1 hypothetical protein [Ornithinimicrobium sp.]